MSACQSLLFISLIRSTKSLYFFFSYQRLLFFYRVVHCYYPWLYLTISFVRSCQYVSQCQKLWKYSKRFKNFSDFSQTDYWWINVTWWGYVFWHLTLSLVRSCQYVSACQHLSKYSELFKSYSDFPKLITNGRTDNGQCDCKSSFQIALLRIVQFYFRNIFYHFSF